MKPSLSKKETAIFSYRFLENEYEPLNNIHETFDGPRRIETLWLTSLLYIICLSNNSFGKRPILNYVL